MIPIDAPRLLVVSRAGAQTVRRAVLPVMVGLGGLLVWALILTVVLPLGAIIALVGWTADQVWERS